MTTPYDDADLRRLGARRKKLLQQLADLDAELNPVIAAACAALYPQETIKALTGYRSRNSIRVIAREQGVEPPASWSRASRAKAGAK